MGENVERLGRLESNRESIVAAAFRAVQDTQRTVMGGSVDSASVNMRKAAQTDGFEGKLGDTIKSGLLGIRDKLEKFTDYQAALNKSIAQAHQALQDTASAVKGLPSTGLTAEQQSTLDMATQTESPVQVSPGVTMTPSEAKQYYADQAEAEQEEAARKMAAALDKRLQEIIDGMPESDYDPPKPPPEDPASGDGTGDGSSNYGGVSGGTDGTGSGSGSGGGQYIGPRGTGGTDNPRPPQYVVDPRPPHYVVDPPHRPPYDPPYDPNDPPNVDGGGDGTVPGGPGGPGGPRVVSPGGPLTGGVGGPTPGGVGGLVGGAGVGGAALAGGLRAGGLGAMGGLNSMSAAAGAAGGPGGAGASGVVAQSGGAGGRGGMMAGGGAAGGGKGDKRKRRRGQDLFAFSVDPEEDGVEPDLGAAGSAGSSTSDGREELGW